MAIIDLQTQIVTLTLEISTQFFRGTHHLMMVNKCANDFKIWQWATELWPRQACSAHPPTFANLITSFFLQKTWLKKTWEVKINVLNCISSQKIVNAGAYISYDFCRSINSAWTLDNEVSFSFNLSCSCLLSAPLFSSLKVLLKKNLYMGK